MACIARGESRAWFMASRVRRWRSRRRFMAGERLRVYVRGEQGLLCVTCRVPGAQVAFLAAFMADERMCAHVARVFQGL